MSIQEQIDELNRTVCCRLAPSKIHGVGVFAIRDITKGEELGCLGGNGEWFSIPFARFGEIHKEIRDIIFQRWPQVASGSLFKSPNEDAWLMSFMNFSQEPNCLNNVALRDIKVGEEITEDYPIVAKKF